VAHTLVPGAGHEYGWVEEWPGLLALPLGCSERIGEPAEFTAPPQDFIDAGKGKVF
jgi:hypothetical protein